MTFVTTIGTASKARQKRAANNSFLRAVLALTICLLAAPGVCAADTNQISPEFVRQILERLEKDENEIKELRQLVAKQQAASTQASNTAAAAPDGQLQLRLNKDESELADLRTRMAEKDNAESRAKYPFVQFHGFGDLDFAADNRHPQSVPGNVRSIPYGVNFYGIKDTFYMGEFDLFLKAQLAEDTSVVSETVLAADSNNDMGVDIERLYLEHRFNDSFIVDLGRFHTSIGYYNTTYHHGTWLQTAIGRPTFLMYEDSGGILPIHMIGLSLHGAVPSSGLNLNYAVELGNGLEYSANSVNANQQVFSSSDTKAINLALTAKPDALPGTQFGVNLYYDHIEPDNSGTTNQVPNYDQFIFGAHAVYNRGDWEFLNEGYLILDKPTSGETHCNPAFYTQLAHKFGPLTPYVRFTYYHVMQNDLLYALDWAGGVNAGVHYGPSVGLRYDFTTFAALKLQYDYLVDSGLNDASRINVQACFTF
ncbi:MAG: hypothetical protein C5B50_27540 [Verrucomicrobia bacterium]|nr:MAG: hypothetical protein C5B50_27540 [Verrucomicrobiota bacterium]